MRLARAPARRQPTMLGAAAGQRRHKPDYILVLLCTALLAIGLVVVYAISPGLATQQDVSENYYVSKQAAAIALGVLAFLVTANMPLKFWRRTHKSLLVSAIIAAIAVQLFGEEVNGAARWIQIAGISFQAVELIKFALLIWLAGFLAGQVRKGELNDLQKTFKPVLIALAVSSLVVAVFQSDLGSAGVIVAIIGGMAFVAGMPLRRILLFLGVIAIGTILAVSTSTYRRERLFTYLNPERDCQNTGYQACQALIAIGSGGMFGKGVNKGVAGYGYVPESANDSIFAVYGEMFGFVGVTVLLGLLVALFSRLKTVMERAPDVETRLLLTGILAWLSTQALINVGAMIGVLPLKGITLPFISYGGTSIIFVTAAIGLAFNVSRYTTYSVSAELSEGGSREDSAYGRRHRRAYHTPVSRRA